MSESDFNNELYSNENYIRKKIKEAIDQSSNIAPVEEKTKHVYVDSIDAEFFTRNVPVAKTVGKFASQDFCRVPSSYEGSEIRGSAFLPPKKSHKKGKK